MSEYQYYEFQTADRRLSEKELRELRAYSTRARITPTSFVNEYSFGDFKGKPDVWMEKYFDGFLYYANWGTHILKLALPATLLSGKTARSYCSSEAADVKEKSGRTILTFTSECEGGDWEDCKGNLSSLMSLRTEMARGDMRCLYLGWLLGVQDEMLENDVSEPPVPPNLGKLSGPLTRFADFLRIDPDLLAVAAKASPRKQTPGGSRKDMVAWIAALPVKDKDKLLLQLMEGADASIGAELLARFNNQRVIPESDSTLPRRTVGQLLTAAETRRNSQGTELS